MSLVVYLTAHTSLEKNGLGLNFGGVKTPLPLTMSSHDDLRVHPHHMIPKRPRRFKIATYEKVGQKENDSRSIVK